jgi:hypothetical protein
VDRARLEEDAHVGRTVMKALIDAEESGETFLTVY